MKAWAAGGGLAPGMNMNTVILTMAGREGLVLLVVPPQA